jgi:hypothetical protein
MSLQDRLEPSPDVVTRVLKNETVLMDMASGSYFGLDAVGTLIWQALDEGETLAAACDRVAESYEIDRAQVEADVAALADAIIAKGLATRVSAPA